MKLIMSACGAAGAASTKVLTQLQDENEKLMETAKEYRNPDIVIPDSRSEMADILNAVRGKLMNDLAKTLSDSVKINAWQFNQLLLMRRAQYLFKIKRRSIQTTTFCLATDSGRCARTSRSQFNSIH